MSEKSITQEINELLDIERDMMRDKPIGQRPPREQEMAYYERKRDVFQRIADRATLTGEQEEWSHAVAACQRAQDQLNLLDEEERAEADQDRV